MALIAAPASEVERRPDHRSQIDVEIHGSHPEERAAPALGTVGSLLAAIDQLRSQAEALAPSDWKAEHRNVSGDDLFLEGFEFHDEGLVRVLFDFGDLDLLILDLHADGRSTASVEP
ncbi:MAG: hypothetical protein Q7T73_03435 [Beijerinckiaceae bacterium]|nr:hypothetical protein [Beijerinckiaceae bacterium]